MKKRTEVLLDAMVEMKKLSAFQDKAKELLNMEVYELQPSLTTGVLYDALTDQLLTQDGVDICAEFMFGGIPYEYGEENPYVIKVSGTEGRKEKEFKITTPKEMVDFLHRFGYFKKKVDLDSYDSADRSKFDKDSAASKLHDRLVQTCIDYINETGDKTTDRVEFNADCLQASAKHGKWCPCTDSYCGVEKWDEGDECYKRDSESM